METKPKLNLRLLENKNYKFCEKLLNSGSFFIP